MASLETLTASIAAQPSLESSVTVLVDLLAERIKATSNDQNIQKLARELKGLAPAVAAAIAAKQVTKIDA